MHRAPDWEARLAAYLDTRRGLPFAYGKNDCCLFAAGAVLAMTGVDSMPEFRGKYSTARGSVRALRKFGAGTLEATLDTKFQRLAAPALAHRGDLVMAAGNLGISMGADAICVGQEGDREGLVRLVRNHWTAAWRVPHMASANG